MLVKGGGLFEVCGDCLLFSLMDGFLMIVFDNMLFYGELFEINFEDIGQIDVLKDVLVVVVYGVCVVNGVVIIIIKKGKIGKFVINFSVKVGFVIKVNYKEVYDGDGYMKYCEDWYKIVIYGMNFEIGKYEVYQMGIIKFGYYDCFDCLFVGVFIEDWCNYLVNVEGQLDFGIYVDCVLIQIDQLICDNFFVGRIYDWYNSVY